MLVYEYIGVGAKYCKGGKRIKRKAYLCEGGYPGVCIQVQNLPIRVLH